VAEETLEIRIRAIQDGVAASMNQTRAAVNGLAQSVQNAGGVMDPAARRMRYLNQAAKDLGRNMIIAGAAIGGALGLAVKSWTDMSMELGSFQAVSGATSGQMKLLQNEAMRLGEKFGMSSVEVVGAATALQKAGVSTADILGGALSGALSIAASDAMSLADAAEIASIAMTQFGLAGKDVPHVADLLATGAAEAVGDVKDLGWALRQSGLVANMFGLSIEDTIGTLSAFAAQGLIGSDAGTSFKSMLLALASPSKIAQRELDRLGISMYDSRGKFIGITGVAGQLQDKMVGLDEKTRNASMSIIFGQDAIRSATALYKLGAAGLEGWIQKVDQAGKAEEMATKRLNNLGGDFKKLQATFQNTLISMGQSADGFLRPVVQAVTDALRWFRSLDEGSKGMIMTFAAVAGGGLLLAGSLLSLVPRIADTIQAFRTLNTAHPGLVSGLGKVGIAAGVVAGAFLLLKGIGMIFTQNQTKSVEDMTQALIKLRNTKDVVALDEMFRGWSKLGNLAPVSSEVDTLAEAVGHLISKSGDGFEQFSHAADGLRQSLSLPKSELGQLKDRFEALDNSMSSLVTGGRLDTAALGFNKVADAFEKNGKSAKDALESLPGYRDALQQVANAAEVDLTQEELLDFARGKIPPRLAAAQAAHEGAAKAQEAAAQASQTEIDKLAELGVQIDGRISDLDRFIDALFRTSDAMLGQRDASRKYLDAIDRVTESVQKNGATLDTNTKAGRENEAAYDAMAAAGVNQIKAMAKNGASQDQLQGKLRGTYEDLIAAAGQFGVTGGEAEALARKVLGIPDGVSIDSWMSDYAIKVAQATQAELDRINGKRVQTYIDIVTTRTENIITRSQQADEPGVSRFGLASGGEVVNYLAAGGRPRYLTMVPRGTDKIPAMLTPGEHVWAKQDVDAAGGQGAMYAMRAAVRSGRAYADALAGRSSTTYGGGAQGPAQFTGNLYLESGELLGVVRGVAEQVLDDADRDMARRRFGG
jgi:TP901 family phage tail tape measure protein